MFLLSDDKKSDKEKNHSMKTPFSRKKMRALKELNETEKRCFL